MHCFRLLRGREREREREVLHLNDHIYNKFFKRLLWYTQLTYCPHFLINAKVYEPVQLCFKYDIYFFYYCTYLRCHKKTAYSVR